MKRPRARKKTGKHKLWLSLMVGVMFLLGLVAIGVHFSGYRNCCQLCDQGGVSVICP